jgi:hypothetical protein
MRLYVWEKVLHDYGAGMIVALAPDLDSALEMGRAEGRAVAAAMGEVAPEIVELGLTTAEIARAVAAGTPRLWFVYGGG